MSLSSRLIWTVTLTVALALVAFVSLTTWRIKVASNAQERAIEQRLQVKFSEQLRLEGQLMASFLERIEEGLDASISALAGRDETRTLVERGNIVAIDLTMQKAAIAYGLNSVVVLDRGLKAIGSHSPGLDLLAFNAMFSRSALYPIAATLLDQFNRDSPKSHRRFMPVSADQASASGIKLLDGQSDGLSIVSIHPVFDDFGDVLALVVGQRLLSGSDVLVDQFAKDRQLGIEVRNDDAVMMRAGLDVGSTGAQPNLSKCSAFKSDWQVCVHTPRTEMKRETSMLTKTLEVEYDGLIQWVTALSVVSLLVSALFSSFATRRVMAPLAQITGAVRSVAKGNWLTKVSGQRRSDEVGEIARAVTVLQQSVKEREQLLANIADVQQLRESRAAMLSTLADCRTAVRQRMFRISDGSESVEISLNKLSSLISLAEGEADETRLIAIRLAEGEGLGNAENSSQARLVCDATDRLCETLTTIGHGNKDVAGELESLVGDVSALDRTVKDFLAELEDSPTLTSDQEAFSPKLLEAG